MGGGKIYTEIRRKKISYYIYFSDLDFRERDWRWCGCRGWSADMDDAEEDKDESIDIEDWLECFSFSISDKAA